MSQSICGKVAKISPTMESVHGIKRSSEPSQPITSPEVWAKPLFIACHGPSSGSEIHHASSPSLSSMSSALPSVELPSTMTYSSPG